MRVDLAGRTQRSRRRIGLTPLADLVFILLVFFILETNFIDFRQLDFRLPQDRKEGESRAGHMELQLFASGHVWLEGSSFSVQETAGYFKREKTDPDTLIVLKAEDAVALQTLVNTMDQLDGAGMKKVLIQRLEP